MANAPVLMPMPLFSSLQFYNPTEVSLTSWLELFQEFCRANVVPPEQMQANGVVPHNRKRALFLSYLGTRVYEVLRLSCLPNAPNQSTIPELIAILRERYEPPGLTTTNRYNFEMRTQRENESAADFIDALQNLATPCAFGLDYFDRLRDRIVHGCRSSEVRKKLMSEDNLTFVRAKQIIVKEETVNEQCRAIAAAIAETVSAVHHGNRPNPRRSNPRNVSQEQQQQQHGECSRCGRHHDPQSCPAKCFSEMSQENPGPAKPRIKPTQVQP